MAEYEAFLAAKKVEVPPSGLERVPALSPKLFPWQRETVAWALRRGRAALFEDCGLGKTAQQLEWARIVAEHTARPVLILTPLAVAHQTRREGEKFDVPVRVCREAADVIQGVNVTNYERLDKFDASTFGGVVLDESSILKSYMGKTKRALQERFAATPFRLACTATPAPNDHLELGNHSEFLGIMSSHQMIARWFINDTSTFGTYTLKGHARVAFWDWVATWARCIGAPSDLGYPDDGFALPELRIHKHVVDVDVTADRGAALIRMPDMSATAVHQERRRTAADRARRVAELVTAEPSEPWLVWVETDYDAAAVMEYLGDGAVEVRGPDSAEAKERALLGFADGDIRVLVTKPKIAGFGLNWQHCARLAFAGPGFSYEAFYQAVRRAWRFGQTRPVDAHVVLAATELHVWDVVAAKADGHDEMKVEMFAAMRRAQTNEARAANYEPRAVRLPAWLRSA